MKNGEGDKRGNNGSDKRTMRRAKQNKIKKKQEKMKNCIRQKTTKSKCGNKKEVAGKSR